jgi:hypothetical protein
VLYKDLVSSRNPSLRLERLLRELSIALSLLLEELWSLGL